MGRALSPLPSSPIFSFAFLGRSRALEGELVRIYDVFIPRAAGFIRVRPLKAIFTLVFSCRVAAAAWQRGSVGLAEHRFPLVCCLLDHEFRFLGRSWCEFGGVPGIWGRGAGRSAECAL